MLKIKIVHVVGRLGRGGAERYVVDLCNEIAKVDKYEVFVVSLCANHPDSSFINDINTNVKYVTFNKTRGFSILTLFRLTSWLKQECPHVVHSHLNALEYLSVYRFYKSRTSFFHTLHNIAKAECANYGLKNLRKISYRSNSVIPITISHNGSRTYREYYRLCNDITIQNARPSMNPTANRNIIHDKYKSLDDSFLLVNVGNISLQKNQEMLIKAVKKYNSTEKIKCRLLILGEVKSDTLFYDLKNLTNDDAYIEFLGGKQNVADYLSIADAFCLSSIHEGMPISLIEAMCLGCIPICTPVGGVKEMIRDEVTGFLSKGVSIDAFCDALKRVVNFPKRDAIKKNVMEEFKQKYHINISAERHLKTYNKALNLFEGNDNAFELLYKSKFLNVDH